MIGRPNVLDRLFLKCDIFYPNISLDVSFAYCGTFELDGTLGKGDLRYLNRVLSILLNLRLNLSFLVLN